MSDQTVSKRVTVGLYAVLALAAGFAAYMAIFSQFAGYDDEGTLLTTIKAFAQGDVLYRDIYSQYGPFYYELFGGLFALTGNGVTNDAGRSIVIVVWVAASLLIGIAGQRLTGRLSIGILGTIATFAGLGVLISEPMHPHGLSVLLIGAFVLLAACGPGKRAGPLAGSCGVVVAALILTKVNLGAFAIAAIALAAVLTVGPLYRRRWVRWPVIAAFLLLPLAITARDLSEPWVRDLILIEVLAALAIMVAGATNRPAPADEDRDTTRWLLAAGAGFAAAFVLFLLAALATGPSPSDLYEGIIGFALRIRDVLVAPLPLPSTAVDWAVAALAAAVIATRLGPADREGPSVWPGILRGAAGIAILGAVAHIAPFSVGRSAGNPDLTPLLLAWVAAIAPAGARETPHRRFLRVLLPALAMAETLQVYPVAGSQMGIASVIFVPVGALCLGDALDQLRAWSAARGDRALERFAVVAGVGTLAIVGLFALNAIARPAVSNAIRYHEGAPLSVPGASMVHLPQEEVDVYAGLVDLVKRHRCTALVGYPSLPSLYLWTGIEPPPLTLPDAWMKGFDDEQQQRVVDATRRSPRPCAIRSDTRAEAWLNGEDPGDAPLVRYILDDFKPVAESGDFQFMVPR